MELEALTPQSTKYEIAAHIRECRAVKVEKLVALFRLAGCTPEQARNLKEKSWELARMQSGTRKAKAETRAEVVRQLQEIR